MKLVNYRGQTCPWTNENGKIEPCPEEEWVKENTPESGQTATKTPDKAQVAACKPPKNPCNIGISNAINSDPNLPTCTFYQQLKVSKEGKKSYCDAELKQN